MENITHTTARGSTEFGLTNTNKLIRQYEYATGLKTGSTGLAKYCVSATAEKDGIELIAVIMAAPDPKVRFHDAVTLLNYGYGLCRLYEDENKDTLPLKNIRGGIKETAAVQYEDAFHYLSMKNEDLSSVVKEIRMEEIGEAPVKKGQKAGEAVYMIGNERIGSVDLVYAEDVEKAVYGDYLKRVGRKMLL